jgi:hypothetical protein
LNRAGNASGYINPGVAIPHKKGADSSVKPEFTEGVPSGTSRCGVRSSCRNLAGTDFDDVFVSVLVVEAASGRINVESELAIEESVGVGTLTGDVRPFDENVDRHG